MSVIVKGHANHVGTQILAIEGRSQGNNDTDRKQASDSQAIFGFLRAHLPSGTLDLLAFRLCYLALDKLSRVGWIDELAENEVRVAIKDYIAKLDKESK